MSQSQSQRGHHTTTAMVTRHTARGTFMRMLRPLSGNLSYIPNQSRGLNLPEYDGGVDAQNEARIMKPEGSNGDRSVLWKGPKPVNQALVMRRRLVTMSDIQSRLITGSATVWTISSGLTIVSLRATSTRPRAKLHWRRTIWQPNMLSLDDRGGAPASLLLDHSYHPWENSGANGPVQSSVYENHTDDDTAGEPTSASPRPGLCSPVSMAAPAEPHPPPLSSCSLP